MQLQPHRYPISWAIPKWLTVSEYWVTTFNTSPLDDVINCDVINCDVINCDVMAPLFMHFLIIITGAHSPPACFSSPYGCCWDYLTSALGPYGRGCPPCSDNRRYPSVCRRFKTYCLRRGISGRWMRGYCPDSCGHCGKYWKTGEQNIISSES